MSPKTPSVNGRQLIQVLEKLGFVVKRQKGSHIQLFRESDRKFTTVPDHGKRDIAIGTLKGILKDAEITSEELNDLL